MPAKIKQNTSQNIQQQANVDNKLKQIPNNELNQTKAIEKNLNTYLLAVKNNACSAATVRNYKSDIKQFLDFLGEENLDGLGSKPKLLAFAKYQREKGLKDSSIKRKIVSIGQFKSWLKTEGLLKSEIPLSSKQVESASSKDLKIIDARRALDQEIKAQAVATVQAQQQAQASGGSENLAKLTQDQETQKRRRWLGKPQSSTKPRRIAEGAI